jgi:hypothetical protein
MHIAATGVNQERTQTHDAVCTSQHGLNVDSSSRNQREATTLFPIDVFRRRTVQPMEPESQEAHINFNLHGVPELHKSVRQPNVEHKHVDERAVILTAFCHGNFVYAIACRSLDCNTFRMKCQLENCHTRGQVMQTPITGIVRDKALQVVHTQLGRRLEVMVSNCEHE